MTLNGISQKLTKQQQQQQSWNRKEFIMVVELQKNEQNQKQCLTE